MEVEYRKELLRCIELCNKEIKNRGKGINGESTIEQLKEVILPELNKLLVILEKNNLPSKGKKYLNSFANAFTVWGWDMQNPSELFISLTKLNNDYEKL